MREDSPEHGLSRSHRPGDGRRVPRRNAPVERPGRSAVIFLVTAVLVLVTAPAARASSNTVFEQATPGGLLDVRVTLDPTPATCALPVVMTVSATTPPGCVVDLGPDATSEEHLRLQAVARSDKLSDSGRLITRKLRIAWLPSLPGRTTVAGRHITARAPEGRHSAVAVPDIPVEITALLPGGKRAEIRDIAPLVPLPVRRGRTIGICALSCGLLLLILTCLAGRRRRAGGIRPFAEVPK